MDEKQTHQQLGTNSEQSNTVPKTVKVEEDLEEIRKYVQEDYWERGKSKGISGYENVFINWWWVNRWMQCFNQIFPVRDKVILDLGCGCGEMVAAFVTWGADAYGIDISDYAIEKGKQLAGYLEQRINQGSIHNLGRWGNDTVDIIYSNQVFEHLPEKYVEKLVNEMFRVLKPGGFCWLAFVTSTTGLRGNDDPDETHINLHPMDWWRKRFVKGGFREREDIDIALRNTTTGYDHYNYFDYYKWKTIVLQKDDLAHL